MSIKLTDTQLVMLSTAAQRNDHCLVAAPNVKAAAAQKIAGKLIASGLVKEIKAKPGAPVWRRDDEAGQSYALKLTAVGAKAIAIDESAEAAYVGDEGNSREDVEQAGSCSQRPSAPDPSSAGANATAPARPSAPRGGTKLAEVVELLQRDRGATIDQLIDATGWLPHTTRAALTGLRKRGFALAIDRSDKERGSIYRIEKDPSAEKSAPAHSDVAQADCETSLEEGPSPRKIQSASSGVMPMRRHSGGAGGVSPPPAQRSDEATSLSDLIAGLADLDANGLRLQWRNHLGGTLPPICRVGCCSGSWRIRSRPPHSAVSTKRRCASFVNRKAKLPAPLKAVCLKLASPRRGRGPI